MPWMSATPAASGWRAEPGAAAREIRVRLFTWNADEPLDADLIRQRIERAIQGRRLLGYGEQGDAYRLIYAESDGLPGLIIDRYGAYLVVQLLTQAMAARADLIVSLLAELVQPRGIYERSDAEVRQKEDLPPAEGLLWGEAPPETVAVEQPGARFLANIGAGQKTGAYLDQAANRLRVAAYCADREVLDCFCYGGALRSPPGWLARARSPRSTAAPPRWSCCAPISRSTTWRRRSSRSRAMSSSGCASIATRAASSTW